MPRQHWTPEEDRQLFELLRAELPARQIAASLIGRLRPLINPVNFWRAFLNTLREELCGGGSKVLLSLSRWRAASIDGRVVVEPSLRSRRRAAFSYGFNCST